MSNLKAIPWRPLRENDRLNSNDFNRASPHLYEEGFLRTVGESELFYVRSKTAVKDTEGDILLSNHTFTYLLYYNPTLRRPQLIMNLAFGKIAEQINAFEFTHGILFFEYMRGRMPNYLDFYREMLKEKDFFSCFLDIPTRNPFYKEELATLTQLTSLEEKIEGGTVSIEELKSLLTPEPYPVVATSGGLEFLMDHQNKTKDTPVRIESIKHKITHTPFSIGWKLLDNLSDYGGLAIGAFSGALAMYCEIKQSCGGYGYVLAATATSSVCLPMLNANIRNKRYQGKPWNTTGFIGQLLRNLCGGVLSFIDSSVMYVPLLGVEGGNVDEFIGEVLFLHLFLGVPFLFAESSNRHDKKIYKEKLGSLSKKNVT